MSDIIIPVIDIQGLTQLDRNGLTQVAQQLNIPAPHTGGVDNIIGRITREYDLLLREKNIQDAEKALQQPPAPIGHNSNDRLGLSIPEQRIDSLTGEVLKVGQLSRSEIISNYIKGAERLRRVRVHCVNPKMNGVPSEVITVMDRYFGTIRRVVPLTQEFYEEGYHIEQCIYDRLMETEYQHIQEVEGRSASGVATKKGTISMKKAFQITDLAQITPEELAELKANQIASNRMVGR